MLRNSELVQALENDLKGFKICWDAGIQFKAHWLAPWPKYQIECEIRKHASEEFKKYLRMWKIQRYPFLVHVNNIKPILKIKGLQ